MFDAAPNGVVPKIELDLIRTHAEIIHELAAPLVGRGKLIIACFGEVPDEPDPKTGKMGRKLAPRIVHIGIGDVDTMVRTSAEIASEHHRNVYMPITVLRPDLQSRRGREADIVACLGLVGDFDDPDAARWSERLPIPPHYVLETSAGRFQTFIFFDRPEPIEVVKPVAARLKAFANCDHGTADLDHVWRVPGCPNWPNQKKANEGRPREPQLVSVVKPWARERISVVELAATLPEPNTPEQRPDPVHVSADGPSKSGAELSIELLLNPLPDTLRARISQPDPGDRSKTLFYVIKALADRGFDELMIQRIIEAHPQGIGAKYAGRSDLDREIDRVLSKPSRPEAAAAQSTGPRGTKPIIQIVGGVLPQIIDQAEMHLIASDNGIPAYHRASANLRRRYGIGGVVIAAMARRSWMVFKTKRRLKRQAKAAR